jgi:hypothetical protein
LNKYEETIMYWFWKRIQLFIFIGMIAVQTGYAQERYQSDISKTGPHTVQVDLSEYSTVLYVSGTKGSDQEGDGSRTKPWQTLTNALFQADGASGSGRTAVLVAAGKYAEWTFKMRPYVDLFGGFHPDSWKRDIHRNSTVLDGQRVRRVVTGASHARIDGFIITRGVVKYHGGGILCDDSSPTISNNFILDNMTLEPEDFDHNRIHQYGYHGGGIACLYNAVPVIVNNVISGNKTSVGMGAGIVFYGWLRIDGSEDPVLKEDHLVGGLRAICENNVIIGNTAGINDLNRTRSSSGGAIASAYESRPIIRNNVIAGNRAKGRSDAGGIYCEFYSYPDIIGNWVVGNVSDDDGGGIYSMRLGQPLITDNFIAGNWTTGGGSGGVRLSKEGRGDIYRNIIVHNQSGGGVQCVDSYMRLVGNTIMHNKGGGALTIVQNYQYFPGCQVRDNIMRGNEGEEIKIRVSLGNPVIAENNNIQGGFSGEGNFDEAVPFNTSSLSGSIKNSSINKPEMTTTFSLQKGLPDPHHLAGRIIRFMDHWTVIREAGKKSVTVWGVWEFAEDEKLEYEILADYQK